MPGWVRVHVQFGPERRCVLLALRRAAALAVLLVLVAFATPLRADSRTAFLIDRLRSDDFRVRTNAALALGATNDEAAVRPLCGAVSDANEVVRQAAAAALKRLGRASGVGCLKARLSVEPSAAVKLQLSRAIESIEAVAGGGGDGPPRNVPGAKFYVAVAAGTNNGGRDLLHPAMSALKGKLDAAGAYQLAPQHESPDAARSVMSRRNLKGFYLTVSIDVSDTDRGLKVMVRVAVFGYPGRDLRGEVAPYAIAPGVKRGDTATEDQLLRAVAERAADQFAQNFQ
jgi:hypothetical protein